jgi:hypothetical protein
MKTEPPSLWTRVTSEPEVIPREGLLAIFGLRVTRSEWETPRYVLSIGIRDQTARAARRGERVRAALPDEARTPLGSCSASSGRRELGRHCPP